MSRYIPEHSFIATIKSVHPQYSASFDFSRIVCDNFICLSHDTTHTTSTQAYDYLCLNTAPRENEKFWFLYHQWDDGNTSYEIKIQQASTPDSFKSLIISAKDYVVPYPYVDVAQGWRITWDNQCSYPPIQKKPGKILYEVEPEELKAGELGPVRLNSPNGKDLQVYNRQNFGRDWWVYVTDEDGIQIPLVLDILELNIKHPLEK